MRGDHRGTADIVIPTGRNGFCCIVPCALMSALYGGAATGFVALLWRFARRRRDAGAVRKGGT